MDKKIKFSCYSAERYAKTGNGCCYMCFEPGDMTPEEIQNKKDAMILEQKQRNKEYKTSMKQHPVTKPEVILDGIDKDMNIIYKSDIDLFLDEKTGNSTVLLGSSKRGKSTLLMHLYRKYYMKDISTLFSINKHIKLYNDKTMIKVGTFNKQAEKYIKLAKMINNKTDNRYKFTFMFDDIIDAKFSTLMNQLILTYRNANISTLICLQYVYLLSKQSRANVNNVIMFGFNSDESIEVVIKTYLIAFFKSLGISNMPMMINFYKEVTKNYGCIYIHPVTGNVSFHRLKI